MAASPESLPRRVLREVYGEMHQVRPRGSQLHPAILLCPCVGCETMRVAERYTIPADKARAIVETLREAGLDE